MSHLYLSQHLRDQLGLLASLAYPHETCGVLFGKQVQGHISVHKVEQVSYPEQMEGDFRLELLNPQQVEETAEHQGLEIVGIWRALPDQSHIPTEGERHMVSPGYSYLIASITPGGIAELRSWRLSSNRFEEEDLVS
ncbi:Mov34/MPN/PAD-1 family protein [Sedimenticola sp.]|uniref:Mov34/MPN/PAD-1 family protein n=1 Tax=Sedimenticola sp. TaxID=1940285 RepID=UPI003D0FE9EB